MGERMTIGIVDACWRYPVKSMQGSPVDRLTVDPRGAVGDRTHALVDPATGHILSAKRVAVLLEGRASDDAITLPDDTSVALSSPDADRTLSSWLGRPVHLANLAEAGRRSYEMTFDPPDDSSTYYEIPAPVNTFLDLAAVHLVTTATLRHVRTERPSLDWDVRRFRPNLVLDVDGPGFVEGTWTDRELRVGGATLRIMGPTVRCAMPLRAQPDGIDRQPELFQAMSELNTAAPNHLGAYAEVVTPGEVSVGDEVRLLP